MIKRIRPNNHPMVFRPSPVLKGESAEEFEGLHDALNEELKPRGPLERYLVADMAEKVWEIRRYRRVKTNLINSARRPGVKKLLEFLIECSRELDYAQRETEIYRLTEQWFSDESDKNEVLEIFERFGLDQSAIEAAAVRFAARDLEKLDRLMASQEARLSRALRLLADLRGGFSDSSFAPGSTVSSTVKLLRWKMLRRSPRWRHNPWPPTDKLPPIVATRVAAPDHVRARVEKDRVGIRFATVLPLA